MNADLLRIDNYSLGFRMYEGTSAVLRDVNLRVGEGERVALVGETGCGKSVLLRAILGLLDPATSRSEGSIQFDGQIVSRLSEREMSRLRGRRISMIFQDPATALNPVFRIRAQFRDIILQHGAASGSGEADRLAREALRNVYIDDPDRVLDAYPFQLAGGINQRVMITMALVNRPKLVLADEPGTALDVTVQDQTLRLMREATESSGTATLLVTHNLGVVRQFAERVYVMYAGTIVEEAPVSAIFSSPKHPYTQALLAAVPRLAGEKLPEPIEGMVADFINPPKGCRFHPRCRHAFPACTSVPPTITIAPERRVACVLYGSG